LVGKRYLEYAKKEKVYVYTYAGEGTRKMRSEGGGG
jgi:hypothetical protein